MAKKISADQARKEFTGWLDLKRVSEKKRENNAEAEEAIINAIVEGRLVINEDGVMVQSLIFPTSESESAVNKLTYKVRMTVGDRQEATKGIKATDGEGRLIGYIAALTDQPNGVIKRLDSGEDYETAGAIAVYFL